MRARDLMTTPIIAIEPSASIGEAAKLMLGHHISGLPVVATDGKLVGIVSEGDFLRRTELATERKRPRWIEFFEPGKLAGEYALAHGRKIDEVMTDRVITIGPDAPLDEIVDIMIGSRIKRLPVVDGGVLVGMVSRSDILRALSQSLAAEAATPSTDVAIRDAILAEFDRQNWAGRDMIHVGVNDGVVELTGAVFDGRQRQAAQIIAENVPGVKSVVERLLWVEPISGILIDPVDTASSP
jgi:CBS domain-containing protein